MFLLSVAWMELNVCTICVLLITESTTARPDSARDDLNVTVSKNRPDTEMDSGL